MHAQTKWTLSHHYCTPLLHTTLATLHTTLHTTTAHHTTVLLHNWLTYRFRTQPAAIDVTAVVLAPHPHTLPHRYTTPQRTARHRTDSAKVADPLQKNNGNPPKISSCLPYHYQISSGPRIRIRIRFIPTQILRPLRLPPATHPDTSDLTPARLSNAAAGFSRQVSI